MSCACRSTGASTDIRKGSDSNPADHCSRNRMTSDRPGRGCPASERARAATLCAIRQERPPTAESRQAKPVPHAPRLGPGLDLCGVRSAKYLARQGLPCRVQHNGCYVELHITVPPPGMRPDPSNEEPRGDGRGTVGTAGVSSSQASHIHWCACPNNSLGSSRPSFTSEVPV